MSRLHEWIIDVKNRIELHYCPDKSIVKQLLDLYTAYPGLPLLIPMDDKLKTWEVSGDWHCSYNNHKYTIPSGFITDGASIPTWLVPLCGSSMEIPRVFAAVLHDYLYTIGPIQDKDKHCKLRKEADKVYRDYNIQLGMSKFRANFEYYFIRSFGWAYWKIDPAYVITKTHKTSK